MSSVVLTIRQLMISGSFLDVGVKKLATAFSIGKLSARQSNRMAYDYVLVVVDSIFRFTGGGDRDPSRMFVLRFKLFGVAITE